MNVLLNSFHLNGHILAGLIDRLKTLEPPRTAKYIEYHMNVLLNSFHLNDHTPYKEVDVRKP